MLKNQPIGYLFLSHLIDNKHIPHYRASYLGTRRKSWEKDGIQYNIYPLSYKPKNMLDPLDHLQFALKHEGYNQSLLDQLFQKLDHASILSRIAKKPNGVFERRLWYLYESLTKKLLSIPHLTHGNYIDLIDSNLYYTSSGTLKNRQRIRDNLLGTFSYCPLVRKTKALEEWREKHLNKKMIEMMRSIDPRVITRAIHYLFSKETLSSWKIEREYPSQQKAQRYIEQLKACSSAHTPTKSDLIAWQNLIIDDRLQEPDYRKIQNYVGYMMRDFIAHVEYIPPKPGDIPDLMDGLLQLPLVDCKFPVILAAIYSFGFVFIHPFRDGNGRLHRLLLHTMLAQKNYTPKGMIFPLSATMLKHIADYEEILQCYSRPLMKFIDYQFTNNNQLKVLNDTAFLYRSWDMTDLVEYVFQCIEKTIDEEFCEEITYLNGYDKAFNKIRSHTSLSEREIDLIIRCIVQNSGHLGKEKRRKFFPMLSDADVKNCEKATTLYLKSFYAQN